MDKNRKEADPNLMASGEEKQNKSNSSALWSGMLQDNDQLFQSLFSALKCSVRKTFFQQHCTLVFFSESMKKLHFTQAHTHHQSKTKF